LRHIGFFHPDCSLPGQKLFVFCTPIGVKSFPASVSCATAGTSDGFVARLIKPENLIQKLVPGLAGPFKQFPGF
jgi:hypothetical protein